MGLILSGYDKDQTDAGGGRRGRRDDLKQTLGVVDYGALRPGELLDGAGLRTKI